MTTPTAYYFRIAGLYVKIIFLPSQRNSVSLIPSFQPFACKEVADSDLFFQIDVDDNLRPVPKDQRSLIRDFDTGNGNIIVYQLTDGGYQYVIKDINGSGTTILLVEQNAKKALQIADYAYVMETGHIVLQGKASEVAANPQVTAAYLGGKK